MVEKMASNFTALEQAVLKQICAECLPDSAGLEAQLAAATVVSRENTGVGFYTDMAVDRAVASPMTSKRVIGEVWANIDGFTGPMTFLLFVEEGYAVCLEGATVDDSTVDIDLSALKFEILHLPG